MQEQDDGGRSPQVEEHRTSTSERGSFCNATCVCGWRGPARRARERARADAAAHLEA